MADDPRRKHPGFEPSSPKHSVPPKLPAHKSYRPHLPANSKELTNLLYAVAAIIAAGGGGFFGGAKAMDSESVTSREVDKLQAELRKAREDISTNKLDERLERIEDRLDLIDEVMKEQHMLEERSDYLANVVCELNYGRPNKTFPCRDFYWNPLPPSGVRHPLNTTPKAWPDLE